MSLPASLRTAVFDGLQRLYALRLAGSPAGDTMVGVCNIWCDALANEGTTWNEERDLDRVRIAFRRLEVICERWPSPAFFMQCLPPVVTPLAIAPPRAYQKPKAWTDLVEKLTGRKA